MPGNKHPKPGQPEKLGLRMPATLAIDLAKRFDLQDSDAAAVAWCAIQGFEKSQYQKAVEALKSDGVEGLKYQAAEIRLKSQLKYDGCVKPESVARVMRQIRKGEKCRIEYSPGLFVLATSQLPGDSTAKAAAAVALQQAKSARETSVALAEKWLAESSGKAGKNS